VTVDWGDGTADTTFSEAAAGALTDQSHTYADDSTYTVTGTVAEAGGLIAGSDTFDVAVANGNPAITAVSSTTVEEGSASTLTIIASDPAGTNDTLSYYFDFNNDLVYEVGPQPGVSADHTYNDNGDYTVNVRVDDEDGGSITSTTTVTVINANPEISAVSSTTVEEATPSTVTITATDPAGLNDTLSYFFDFDNNGTYEVGPQPGSSADHTYNDNGSYTVNVRVDDEDGGTITDTTTVTVNNANPAITTVSSDTVDEASPSTVTITATDPAGTNDTLSYSFDFDNDTIYEVGPQAGASATHTYADDGSYTVNVRVQDEDGGSITGTTTVTVNNVVPIVTAQADAKAVRTYSYTFSLGSFVDPGDDSDWSVTVDWGDGTTTPVTMTTPGAIPDQSHIWGTTGIKTVTVTVAEAGGVISGSDTFQVTVKQDYVVQIGWAGTGGGTIEVSGVSIQPESPFSAQSRSGSFSGSTPDFFVEVEEDDVILVTATPYGAPGAQGSRFVEYDKNGATETGNPLTIDFDAAGSPTNVGLTVTFNQQWQVARSITGESTQVAVTFDDTNATNTNNPTGTADPEVLDEGVPSDTYTFTPTEGYFVNLIVDSVTEETSSFPVDRQFPGIGADYTIEANILPNPLVVATTGDNGSITPLGTEAYFYGDTPSYKIQANDGFCVASVTVDGAEVWDRSGTTDYAITNANDHDYTFAPLTRTGTSPYTINATFREPWIFAGNIFPFMAQAVWQGAGSWSLFDQDQGVYVAQNRDHLETVNLPCDSRNFTFIVHDQTGWETEDTGDSRVGTTVQFAVTVSGDHSEEGRYKPILTVQTQGAAGTTNHGPETAYEFQSSPTVTADPTETSTGPIVFVNWSGDADGTTASTDVFMNAPKTVIAVFREKTALDVDNDGDGRSPNPDDPVKGQDCDDNDATRAPHLLEIAGNNVDEDCNGVALPEGLGTICLPISDVPLDTELQAAPANVMFILDDSGSMAWEFMTPESQGRFDGESYLFDGHSTRSTLGHGGGDARAKWQSQWHEYNKIYYNPAVTYTPWPTKESLQDPDTPRRFPGATSTATTAMDATFYDLSIAGQGGSPVNEATDLIIDNEEPPAGITVTIDNTDPGYSETGTDWNNGSWGSGYVGSNYRWTSKNQDGTATWDFNPANGGPGHDAGDWIVQVRYRESDSWTDDAKYTVHHDTGTTVKFPFLNQRTNGGVWQSLGEYTFNANSARVVLERESDDKRVIADAVRIVKAATAATGVPRFEIINGSWDTGTQGSNEAYLDHYHDTPGGGDDSTTHIAHWYPHVTEDTDYELFVRFRDNDVYGSNITYDIYYNCGTETTTLPLTTEPITQKSNTFGGQWNLLEHKVGTTTTTAFPFRGTDPLTGCTDPDSEYVELRWRPSDHSDYDANADAIAWVAQGAPSPALVKMANSHYYVRGTDDEIYLVNLTGKVSDDTLERKVYLFDTAVKTNEDDTVDPGDLTEVTDPATLQSLGLLQTDSRTATIDTATAGDLTLNVNGLESAPDPGAFFTIEGDTTFYRVLSSTTSAITLDQPGTGLAADISASKAITFYRSPEQDRRNFANWFSFYRARHLAAKGAVGHAINQIRGVQIGLYSLWGRLNQPVLKVKLGSHPDRTNDLLNILYNYTNSGGTPLRIALRNVGRYFHNDDGLDGGIEGDDATLTGNPWYPEDAGGNCQQSFAILMTDGFWNGSNPEVGDADQGKDPPYRDHPDTTATTYANTLADVAQNFWNTDMVSTLDNDVPTNFRDSNNQQHMVTYTVAFGVTGTLNPDEYDLYNTVETDRSFPIWPDPFSCSNCQKQIDDMWHAAVNGRGIFLSAEDPGELVSSLTDVMQNVLSRIGSGASVSINGEELHAGTVMFQSSYSSDGWTGDVRAYEVVTIENQEAGEKIGDVRFDKPLWSASFLLGDLLPKPNPDWTENPDWDRTSWDTGRVIATYDPVNELGKKFRYDQLTTAQRDYLPGATATEITRKINYLRGDNTFEEDKPGGSFRQRLSKMGDIVHSSPLYQGYVDGSNNFGVLYVGGNDGMLHAFYADESKTHPDNGKELFAYVPNLIFPKLNDLTLPTSTHQFYVDATPFVRDTGTQKILLGGLGRGGKGIYALDVTNPLTHTEANVADWVLWEYPRDNTPQTEIDQLGYTYGRPFMVRSNDPEIGWVVLIGNGYDSKAQCPTLFVLRAFDTTEGGVTSPAGTAVVAIKASATPAIPTCTGDCNGLSEPLPVDLDGNSTVDYVYAGDLRGNLWKFDLTSANHNEWDVYHETATGDPAPLFTAKGPGNTIQPITTTPSIMKHPDSDKPGFLVVFGTGKYLHTDDMDPPADVSFSTTQTMYGIWDFGDASPSADQNSNLKDPREFPGTLQRAGTGLNETNTLSNLNNVISLRKQTQIFYQEVHFFTCDPEEEGGDPVTRSVAEDPAAPDAFAAEKAALEAQGCSEDFSRFLRVLSKEPVNWKTEPDDRAADDQSPNPTDDEANHVGWYFDLPHATDRERVIRNGLIRDGKYVVITSIPRSSPCSAGGDSIFHEIDAATGGRLHTAQFDIDLDAAIGAGDLIEIANPAYDPDDPDAAPATITVAPTGIHFRKMMYPPVILRMPDDKTEMKYFSTASGNITMVQEVAEQRGLYYWRVH